MYDFHLYRDNARVIVKNLPQVRTLRFEGASVYRDGLRILFNETVQVNEIELQRCFLKDDDGETADPFNLFPLNITFNLKGRKWHRSVSAKTSVQFEWDKWMT